LSKSQATSSRRDGCGFLVLTCLFSCFFLVLNSALVVRFYPMLAWAGPSFLRNTRIEQMMMFIGPVLLIVVEWWLVDLIVDLLSPLSNWRERGGGDSRQPDIR
jgi:hypothetical protein